MAYLLTTATDTADLLDKVRTFLLASGWSVNFWGDRTAAAGKVLTVAKAGNHYTLLTDSTTNSTNPSPKVAAFLHSAYAANANPETQPDASARVWANRVTGPTQAVHLFAGEGKNGPYAHVAVETDPGTFKHFGIGVLDTRGVVATGAYAFGTNWAYSTGQVNDPNNAWHGVPFDDVTSFGASERATIFRADHSAVSPRYHDVDNFTGQTAAGVYRGRGGFRASAGAVERGSIHGPAACGASELTGRAPLLPLWVSVDRTSGLWSDVGQPPDMRFVRMDNLEPGQEYPLGTDTWLVFPVIRKNAPAGLPNSGVYGFAYRKVP